MKESLSLNLKPISENRARELNPQVLAFVGDAVYTLFIRTMLVENMDGKSNSFHKQTTSRVKAEAQSKTIEKLFECMTENELYFYKRGRNVKTANSAKNAKVSDYRRATGFEALVGYLYLTGQNERLITLLSLSEKGEILCQE